MRVRPGPAAVFVAVVFAVAVTGGVASAGGIQVPGAGRFLPVRDAVPPSGWEPVWSDGFAGPEGAGVSSSWAYDTGSGVFGTGEIETMTNSAANVHLDGKGDLAITAIEKGTSWTSGRIQTARQFTPPSGRETMVSATVRQPDAAGEIGYWPAFWMLGPGASPQGGEIDVLEDVNGLSEHSGTLHCGTLVSRNGDGTYGPCHESTGLTSGLLPCAGCQGGYHTYSVVIDRRDEASQQIRWYLDGTRFWSVTEQQVGTATWTQAVDHGFSIILDLAVGGSWPSGQCQCTAPGPATSSGGTMSVSDVTVYER